MGGQGEYPISIRHNSKFAVWVQQGDAGALIKILKETND